MSTGNTGSLHVMTVDEAVWAAECLGSLGTAEHASDFDYPVPWPDCLLPGYIREPFFDFRGELSCCVAEHGEVPQQGVTVLTIGFHLPNRDTGGSAAGPARLHRLSRRAGECHAA